MGDSLESVKEKIIKSRKRVQNHGEVFTPKRIVRKILDLPKLREESLSLTSRFLEPSVGEGGFLMEVLSRKLKMVEKNCKDDLVRYENYSLLALSTLYGIELLEDNAKKCVMNMYQLYYEAYRQQTLNHNTHVKNKILSSAKLIISCNIAQGNFITRRSSDGNPIIFSEWHPVNLDLGVKTIIVQRTEYTIEEILQGIQKRNGETVAVHAAKEEQLDLYDLFDEEEVKPTAKRRMKYVSVKITEIYKEEMEELHE